jgi:hypothetical protein
MHPASRARPTLHARPSCINECINHSLPPPTARSPCGDVVVDHAPASARALLLLPACTSRRCAAVVARPPQGAPATAAACGCCATLLPQLLPALLLALVQAVGALLRDTRGTAGRAQQRTRRHAPPRHHAVAASKRLATASQLMSLSTNVVM